MTTLTQLAERLETAVPAVDGVPSAGAYEQAIRDAVSDFGYRVSRVLRGTISITSGTATYALPDGFLRLIALGGLGAADVFRDAAGFLVPVSSDLRAEQYELSGGEITFYPTPAYALDRTIRYAAGYPYAAGTDTFTGLTAEGERIVLLKAQANVLRAQSVAAMPGAGLNYRIGDVSVQRPAAQPQAELAGDLESAYLEACRSMTGLIGRRAEPTGLGY